MEHVEKGGATMDAMDRLRRDHRILRSKLALLESAIGQGEDAWFVLRELCFTLSRQVLSHMRREEALVARCRRALTPKTLTEIAVEHKDEPRHLRTLNRMFVTDEGQSVERIAPEILRVAHGLREHMAEEERELFPILERTLAHEAEPAGAVASGHVLDETMTVNRVIQEHPDTQPVLERLFVNVPYEGCTCLDEVAWRHGMDSGELITRLEKAIEHGEVGHRCAVAETPPAGR